MLNLIYSKVLTRPILLTKLIFYEIYKRKKIYSTNFHLKKGIYWLIEAQKVTRDGGVSSCYSLIYGWRPSYPETSGYIISTLIKYSHLSKNPFYLKIVEEIADWECSIQLENGGFPGGVISKNKKPIIFNTGQVILGLIGAYKELKKKIYLDTAIKSGDFLVTNQESNGNWLKYCFNNRSHTYNVRVAWALLELSEVTGENKYYEAAKKNLDWAQTQQNSNYWFHNNSFVSNKFPLLHTIAYAIRGFLESGILLKDKNYLNVALNASLKLMQFFTINRYLPARFDENWQSKDFYVCLTGIAQLSIIWLKFYEINKEKKFLINALKLNDYLKMNQVVNIGFKEIEGAIKGSDPIWGWYNFFGFPNWATKFFCDALILEIELLKKNLKKIN
ncbi:MAG: hypothetical protein ACFFAH_00325 [Promethearchaeota archaeon]